VEAVGGACERIAAGDRVAVSPSVPCNHCRYCLEGRQNQCLNMRFYGSAMPFPHVQGAFRESLVCLESQAHLVPENVSLEEAAMVEPLAVALHAVRRAGSLMGKRVLVAGSGPIGALSAIAARRAGAAEVVITDIADGALAFASRLGVERAINVARDRDALEPWKADKGYFDALFEASGAQAALSTGIEVVRPGGVLIQLGLGCDMTIPINLITTKELELRGTFRFHEEYALALEYLGKRLIDVKPLISATVPFAEARSAFELANDRSQSMKVQLAF
jgi:L-idonate 5-dehydrogenase